MEMNRSRYLERIRYHGPLAPTIDTLRSLHLAHLIAVPFENLDIHMGRPILLDEERLFRKIVEERRGGFCYELNGLFAWLLAELGFAVSLHSARVRNSNGFGPEFDHLVLAVRLEERWLSDVGFGESFRLPLRLDDPADQRQFGHAYRVVRDGDDWTMTERNATGQVVGGYAFTLTPRNLGEFAAMCHHHQTSPQTTFTQKRVCTRATPEGRITLSELNLIVTENGVRRERLLGNETEYAAALREHFGIDL
jgi:N-hydroxyarylamine O-acetyltransferase